jgi:AcrR family transcriptional regulator
VAKPVSRRGEGRERVLQAALQLFATHGVSGTSLQMIADHLGVTKASVYFQFHSKEDIVVAILEPVFAQIEALITRAEQPVPGGHETGDGQWEATLTELTRLVVEHRRVFAVLRGDNVAAQVVENSPAWRNAVQRLARFMLGPQPTPYHLVATSVFGAGLMLVGRDHLIIDLDDETLTQELVNCGRLLLTSRRPDPDQAQPAGSS